MYFRAAEIASKPVKISKITFTKLLEPLCSKLFLSWTVMLFFPTLNLDSGIEMLRLSFGPQQKTSLLSMNHSHF